MRRSCYERNDSNPVHARPRTRTRADVAARPMHEPKMSALDEHQHISASALDLNHFSSNKTYACIDLIHTRKKSFAPVYEKL